MSTSTNPNTKQTEYCRSGCRWSAWVWAIRTTQTPEKIEDIRQNTCRETQQNEWDVTWQRGNILKNLLGCLLRITSPQKDCLVSANANRAVRFALERKISFLLQIYRFCSFSILNSRNHGFLRSGKDRCRPPVTTFHRRPFIPASLEPLLVHHAAHAWNNNGKRFWISAAVPVARCYFTTRSKCGDGWDKMRMTEPSVAFQVCCTQATASQHKDYTAFGGNEVLCMWFCLCALFW